MSDEEIRETANRFLLSSPPGEFMEVVTGLFLMEGTDILIILVRCPCSPS